MEYEIVWECEMRLLEEAVMDMIKEGWLPQGGVCLAEGIYIQAMVRSE